MGDLVRVLGDSPRVRLIEALIRLVGFEFTRGELAREADVYRMTTNRQIESLVKDGFIERCSAGSRPRYRVRTNDPTVQVIYYLDVALGLVDPDRHPPTNAHVDKAVEAYRQAVRRVAGLDPSPAPAVKSPRTRARGRARKRRG